ncbi:hypothetical protein ACI65C_007228 [Semiaphis heraclei]
MQCPVYTVHNEEKIKQLVEMYQSGLDCSVLAAVSETKIWQQKFTGTKDLPKNAIDALQKSETISEAMNIYSKTKHS